MIRPILNYEVKAMIMADKIIKQRKRCGWSQEELAEKLGVSRQAISKWEGAQSMPDLGRVLELGQLFGVSTDYLIKDELEDDEAGEAADCMSSLRMVSMEEANAFLQIKEKTAGRIALAVFLCILSPICLILLGAASEFGMIGITDNSAVGVGLVVMLLIVACAVTIFISCGIKTQPYEYLEKEIFETEYGVDGMVKDRQKRYRDTYAKSNISGACLCIMSVVPMFVTIAFTENEFWLSLTIAALLLLAGTGVIFFITAGIRWESMQKLLQEGDYAKSKKKGSGVSGAIKTAYWLIVVAGYLAYSFATNDWKQSWIIWPVAGVLFAAVSVVCDTLEKK